MEGRSVELSVEAAVSMCGRTGIKCWLIEASGEAVHEAVASQTLRISRQPALLDTKAGRKSGGGRAPCRTTGW